MLDVDLILFAIRSALRVGDQVRRAYADSVRSDELTLPLPTFPSRPDISSALSFYEGEVGRIYLKTCMAAATLFNKDERTSEEDRSLVRLYMEHKTLELSKDPGAAAWNNVPDSVRLDINAVLTVRQWRQGDDPNPTVLRRVAGNLIEITIDYYSAVPSAISEHDPRGKALRSFLEAFQNIDFVETDTAELRESLVRTFFVATLDTLRDHPELLADGERGQALVKAVAGKLYRRASDMLQTAPDESARERVRRLATVLFRGALEATAKTVFADPGKHLGIECADQAELVAALGQSLLASTATAEGIDLSKAFNQDSADRLIKAGLGVIARHPALFAGDNTFLQRLVAATAEEFAAAAQCFGSALLPELMRLVVENSAENLDYLLPEAERANPEKHLLVIALKTTMAALAASPPAGSTWTPRFDSTDALGVAEAVVDEVVRNPDWILAKAQGEDLVLGDIVRASLGALQETAAPRLRKATGLAIVEASLRAVGKRIELAQKAEGDKRIVALVVEAVAGSVFRAGIDPKAAWVLARDAAVVRLVELALDEIAQAGARVEHVQKLTTVIDEAIETLKQGKRWTWDDLAKSLRERLKT